MADKKAPSPILYKPVGSPGSGNAGNITISTAKDAKGVDIVDKDGNVITGSRKDTIPHQNEAINIPGPYNQNWWAGSARDVPPGSYIRVTNADGSYSYAQIKDPNTSYKGFSSADNINDATVLPANSHSETNTGVPGQFQPGQAGNYGAIPAYVGGLFPNAAQANYTPITAANYNFTDPFKFASQYGDFSRGELTKNFNQSQDMALQSLDTELKGLQGFVPAASALKRQETSADNQFNQQQRTQQVNTVLPGVNDDLNAQATRAKSYASGQAPDSITDRALELGIRSNSTDTSSAGGFGASSSVARKSSDLASAQQRIQLSQYGDQLLSSNINQKASLNLAPTEYSNAGSTINVNPPVSTSQLTGSYFGQENALNSVSATNALGSNVQQNQFQTQLQQNTNTFNAQNQLQLSEYNTSATNNFALDKFGYQAGYANSVASGTQTDINTQLQLQQQQLYYQLMQQYLGQAQTSQNIGAGAGLLGGLGKLVGGGKGGGGKGSGSDPGAAGAAGSAEGSAEGSAANSAASDAAGL